jgi:hypothetical protein
MGDPLLSDFFLVGGTALALQIGHRRSIDLDLFSQKDFDENALLAEIEEKYGFSLDFQSNNTLKGQINGVKVDFISHKYPLVHAMLNEGGIRMANLADIAAMKINAITGNGTRLKDFVDIAYLSGYLSTVEMMESYQAKYSTRNAIMAIKAMGYFLDIDFTEPIEMTGGKYSWQAVEKRLNNMLVAPDQLPGPMTMDIEEPARRHGRGQ